jgi:hypothetical protein
MLVVTVSLPPYSGIRDHTNRWLKARYVLFAAHVWGRGRLCFGVYGSDQSMHKVYSPIFRLSSASLRTTVYNRYRVELGDLVAKVWKGLAASQVATDKALAST